MDEEDLCDMPSEIFVSYEMALGSGIDGLTLTKEIWQILLTILLIMEY